MGVCYKLPLITRRVIFLLGVAPVFKLSTFGHDNVLLASCSPESVHLHGTLGELSQSEGSQSLLVGRVRERWVTS